MLPLKSILTAATCLLVCSQSPLLAADTATAPDRFDEMPDPIHWTGKYAHSQDGEWKEKSGLPTNQWLPVGQAPRAVVLAIHGLTLHGGSYEVLARGFAAGSFIFVAPDMLGYGRNSLPDAPRDMQKINNEKSYEHLVKLLEALNQKYPQLPIAVLGESLGTSFSIRLAAEHPKLVDAVIVAAPTSKVNPLMYMHPETIAEGIRALFRRGHQMSYKVFFNELVSDEPQIIEELKNDPLNLKMMPLKGLLETQKFVSKTDTWAKGIAKDTPILILQGSRDKAMVPKAVTRLTKRIDSTDQTIRWMTGYSHLLLETEYLRPAALDAISDFIDDHDDDRQKAKQELYGEMIRFGAKPLKDE